MTSDLAKVKEGLGRARVEVWGSQSLWVPIYHASFSFLCAKCFANLISSFNQQIFVERLLRPWLRTCTGIL